jgi:thioredoxin-related protein
MPGMGRERAMAAAVLLAVTAVVAAASGAAGYDPTADPEADLAAAVTEARSSGRRILLVVGGEWCSWCHILDRFVKGNAAIHDLWDHDYVTVKVHWDPDQPNEAFLGRYPRIEGYPHIFVLDDDGRLLHSQNTAELESGDSYSPGRVTAFLKRWAPPAREGAS